MPGEQSVSNGITGSAVLTICVPSYNDQADALIMRLTDLKGADRCTLLIYDDGSGDDALTQLHSQAIQAFPGPARLVTNTSNYGRSHARNRLVARAEADWILLLDADMLPDDDTFLTRYLDQIDQADGPALIAGGFSLEQVTAQPGHRLHSAQAAKSDCIRAAERAREPGRYVFTSNILVHRQILDQIGFDEGFSGWGWEDVDWGLRVAPHFPIIHIDNTATHLGLEPDAVLIRKFGTSGANFARLTEKHPAAADGMALTRAARRMKPWGMLQAPMRMIAGATVFPLPLRLLALKTYRAICYSQYL